MEGAPVQSKSPILRRKLGPVDFERMNLPEEFWRTKIFSVAESVRQKIERFLLHIDSHIEAGRGLILAGKHGVGKTGVASLIAREARCRGYTVFFISLWDFRECVRSRILFDDDQTVRERCSEVDVLVLDALRLEDAKDNVFGSRAFEELVVGRCSRLRTTIVTTRLSDKELFSVFPSFIETTKGSLAIMEVEGPDLREEKSRELDEQINGERTG